MDELKRYIQALTEIYAYFGYEESWKVFPIEDATQYFWSIESEISGVVRYAESEEILFDQESENFYEDEIYTYRHVARYVYRQEKYTMIIVDTHTDGNKFLKVFDNSKERKWGCWDANLE